MEINLCYGCMRELDAPGAVCPRCGYDNTNDPINPEKQPGHVLPCGTILNGQYMVGRSLGQGGFGITYIGYDLNLEVPVCIKEYYPEGCASRSATQSRMVYWGTSENARSMKESRRDFVKEAQKAVKLRDLSHVVTVWGVFYENETAYIVMDYIEGETLKSRLVRTQKTLSERECVELLTPIMEDLETAHARGIIHRDIKPENIMLTADEKPVLLDMGAAKDLGKSSQNGGAPSSAMVVTQGFSPLEQYSASGSIGPWTDVYAMCATIYYCVTGKVPPTPIDRLTNDSLKLDAFSAAFAAVLKKGLALKVEDRIQNMGELIAALRAALDGKKPEPTTKPEPEPKKPVPETNSRGKTRKLPLILGLAAAAVILVFAFKMKKTDFPAVLPEASATPTAMTTPEPTPAAMSKLTATPAQAAGLRYEVFSDSVCITDCDTGVEELVIPAEIEGKPVTGIGNSAFNSCGALRSVTIPDSVTSIGSGAFYACNSLTSITIPDGVTGIGNHAFYGCSTLESVTIPDGVTSIGNLAFSGCDALKEVCYGGTETQWKLIGIGRGNESLTGATITCVQTPAQAAGLRYEVFDDSVYITDCDTSVEELVIPAEIEGKPVTGIGNSAFNSCGALRSVTIPDSVTSIDSGAFYWCTSLRSVTIPDSVTGIGKHAFYGCSSLESVTIPDGIASIKECTFFQCESLTEITIPNSVTSISGNAFNRCSALRSVTIPDSVTSIGNGAFSGCESLTNVFYGGTEAQWKLIWIGNGNEPLIGATIHCEKK